MSLPFGDGSLGVGGTIVHFPSLPAQVGSGGTVAYGPCFGDAPISTITGVVPGSGVTKRYQAWYRDPGGPCGFSFNLSNGLEIIW